MRKRSMYILIVLDIVGIGFNISIIATRQGNVPLSLLAITLFSVSAIFASNSISSKGK